MSVEGPAIEPGVYRLHDDGTRSAVHLYLDDGYELGDIAELLDIGTPSNAGSMLSLSARERRLLEVTAHAQSFDHAAGFISMCLDIAAMTVAAQDDIVRLISEG